MLRIALDLSHTRLARAGVARHALGLYEALLARDDVEVVPLGLGPLLPWGSAAKRTLALRHDLAWYPLQARGAARRAGAQVYHVPAARGPLWRGGLPVIVAAHDATPFTHPETMSGWNRRYSRRTFRRLLHAADRVIALAQCTADDFVRLADLPEDRIRVIPTGVHERFFGGAAGPAPVAGPYVLFVGTPEPRKNLPRLLDAMRRRRASGHSERLVIAGGDAWGNVALGDAVVMGRVTDEALHALYTHARCLVLPSLHEGFGIPAAEAMACGCAVVASRSGALPEVCGEAAVLVDPLDADDIARGIDAAIADGERLRAMGRLQARRYRWEAVAEATVAVYRELV